MMSRIYPFIYLFASLALGLFFQFANAAASEKEDVQPQTTTVENPIGTVTLGDTLALALRQNPGLVVFSWDIRVAEARDIQARLRPNPELSFEAEDVRFNSGPKATTEQRHISSSLPTGSPASSLVTFGTQRTHDSGTQPGLSEAQLTLRLSQIIELGGKRTSRILVAQRGRDVAAWDYEVARADILAQTAKAYYEVVAAQERVLLAEQLVSLAEQVYHTISARVEAGKASPIEISRGQIELSSAILQRDQARRALEAARIRLAATWGATAPQFTQASGTLEDAEPLPSLEMLQERAAKAPNLVRWMAELEQRDAAIQLEHANAKSDLTVSLGFRSTGLGSRKETSVGFETDGSFSASRAKTSSEENREQSLVLGLSLPLPIFSRNQGRLLEAERLASKSAAQRHDTEVRIQSGLASTHHMVQAAAESTAMMRDKILPSATEAFEATQKGYQQGKFGLLDVLLAQSTLFDARKQYIEALAAYQQGVVELERFTGQPLPNATNSDTKSVNKDTP